MDMPAYVARRLLQMVPVVLGVTILVFFMIHLVPGDPARTMLGVHASPERIALLHKEWGLDKSLLVQYKLFMSRLLHGDLGDSLFYHVPARELIIDRLPVTLWLIGYGTALSILIAMPLAALAASKRDAARDHVVRVVPLIGLGFPSFWVGIMLLLAFGLNMGRLFPVGGYGTGFAGHIRAMFLPALTVAIAISPILIRSLRASLLNVLESDYVTTARSKGLPERRVLIRHALRNAVISTVTILGVNIGYLVGGTLVIEQVFALPGVGQLMINSIFQRDFPVVQGVTLVFAILVVIVYLLTDIVHSMLDPRVRFEMTVAAEGFVEAQIAEPRHGFRSRWYRTPAFVAGVIIVGTILTLAILAPLIAPYDPNKQDLQNILADPSSKHWLGTDQLGRDVWSRMLYAGRVDLRVGFLAVLLPFLIGTTLGAIAGYYGRFGDTLVSRVAEVVVAFPFFVLIIAMVFVLGPGTRNIYLAITRGRVGVVHADHPGRGARGQTPGVHARRPGGGPLEPAHHRAPPPPERHHPGDRVRDVRHRARHPAHRHARLPWPRHPAADARLGHDDRRRADVHHREVAAEYHPRGGRRHHRARAFADR